MAHVVGASGRVLGVEIDAGLAAEARANLAGTPWVEVRIDEWLDALAPGGRMVGVDERCWLHGPSCCLSLAASLRARDDPTVRPLRTSIDTCAR